MPLVAATRHHRLGGAKARTEECAIHPRHPSRLRGRRSRGSHSATLLRDGRVLLAGGVSYGGIGIYYGSLSTAELYVPEILIPAPTLVSVVSDGRTQGAIFHAGTTHVVGPDDPALVGESVDIYCTGLTTASAIPPQVAIGGRVAAVVAISNVAGVTGVIQVRVRSRAELLGKTPCRCG